MGVVLLLSRLCCGIGSEVLPVSPLLTALSGALGSTAHEIFQGFRFSDGIGFGDSSLRICGSRPCLSSIKARKTKKAF